MTDAVVSPLRAPMRAVTLEQKDDNGKQHEIHVDSHDVIVPAILPNKRARKAK